MQSIQPIQEIIAAADGPLAAYEALVAQEILRPDDGQAAIAQELQAFFKHLAEHEDGAKSGLRGFFSGRKKDIPKLCGLYVWGDVGRGKSMLMDLFYDKVEGVNKRRVHFHAFMQEVHSRIHSWRQLKPQADLIKWVAEELANEVQILCLDEMQVHDITDASILSRLFTLLFQQGVLVVFTSNRPPMELYKNGIQRDQFVPFIELIERHMNVLKIMSDTDYRLEQLRAIRQSFLYPLDAPAAEFLHSTYEALTQSQPSDPVTLEVHGRRILIEKTTRGVAWMTFAELCERPLGAADFLEIASVFHTVLLQDIPELSPEKRNEANRFVTFIDALYEHRVKLICTAAAPPEHLYPKGDGSFEFERTVSRLLEMQSERYMGLEHVSG
jgi:cell division protein ZapE